MSVSHPGSISASHLLRSVQRPPVNPRINRKWMGGGHFCCVQSVFPSLSASHVHLLCQESSSLFADLVANHRQHFELQHPAQGHLDTSPVSLEPLLYNPSPPHCQPKITTDDFHQIYLAEIFFFLNHKDSLESLINLMCKSLDCGRKPKNLEKTHAGGEGARKRHMDSAATVQRRSSNLVYSTRVHT